MATAVLSSATLDLPVAGAPVVAPLPTPRSAPAYVPPVDPYIYPAPTLAQPPNYQIMGTGGTPFGDQPVIYAAPPLVPYTPNTGGRELDTVMTRDDDAPVSQQPVERAPKGSGYVMPVLKRAEPIKPPVAPQVTPVEKPAPGPITGTVAGFDLARVPLWAWLVGAALIGSRLLK